MARKKISEFSAKLLLLPKLGQAYSGVAIKKIDKEQLEKIDTLDKTKNYVVKVDQGIKKRGKQGLIGIKVSPYKIKSYLKDFAQKGYTQFLIEEFVGHAPEDEKYLSLERTREGILMRYSLKGGMDIEEHLEEVTSQVLNPDEAGSEKIIETIALKLDLDSTFIKDLLHWFEEDYISFLEINPLVVTRSPSPQPSPTRREREQGRVYLLDLAVEVDSAGEFFVKNSWTKQNFVDSSKLTMTAEEQAVMQLKENSQASLKLDVLNPQGSIFTLLSGGGASITLADELQNLHFGKELVNYADYSGNPNQEETYLYTKHLLSLLFKSKAPKKALIIGGGVANFTDVRITFRGILQALGEVIPLLQKNNVKIFVRRGGPNQKEGLQIVQDFLLENHLLGGVWDQTMVLTDVVNKAIEYVKH